MKKYYALIISFVWMSMSAALATPNNSCQVNWPREFQAQEFQDLYERCMPRMNATDIQQGQYVFFEEESYVSTNAPRIIAQTLQEITDVVAGPSETRLTLHQTIRELVNDQWHTSQTSYSLVAQNLLFKGLTKPLNHEVKYFNFKSQTGYMPVPQAVQQQPDCGGIANCSQGMRFFQVNFDRFYWETPYDQPVKHSFELIFSPDMPLLLEMNDSAHFSLSQMFRGCTQGTFIDQANQVHVLRNCQAVSDFSF